MTNFKDFHKVENISFNISKLQQGLDEVLKIKNGIFYGLDRVKQVGIRFQNHMYVKM